MSIEFHKKMSKLFKEDPETFEKEKERLVEEAITNAPPHIQLKLRLLQAKFDSQMRKAGSEENRLAFAREMMLDKFLNEFNPVMQELAKMIKEK